MYQITYNPDEEIRRLVIAIENLRKELINKVRQRDDLQNPEVIKLSKKLDISIDQYYRLTIDLGQK